MKKYMTTLEYLVNISVTAEEYKLFSTMLSLGGDMSIESLLLYLDNNNKNYWSYPLDEIHFETFNEDDNLVMVIDGYGNARVFEVEETETW